MWVAHLLLRDSARPRAASVVFAASVLLNLFGGRITFLVGLAAAMLAVLALVRRHPWLAGAATVVSVLGSPLAGLFTGIVAAAVLVSDRSRRREALVDGRRHGRLARHPRGAVPQPRRDGVAAGTDVPGPARARAGRGRLSRAHDPGRRGDRRDRPGRSAWSSRTASG